MCGQTKFTLQTSRKRVNTEYKYIDHFKKIAYFTDAFIFMLRQEASIPSHVGWSVGLLVFKIF